MKKLRLDQALVKRKLVNSNKQAQSYIKLGLVKVSHKLVSNVLVWVSDDEVIEVKASEQFVSRAGLKLSSVANDLGIDFSDKIVLDVGSSTGGFTYYSVKHGAKKVVAVDVGSNQLHPSLRNNPLIELYEQCDIRDFNKVDDFDLILIDVSFISLKEVMPTIYRLADDQTKILAMFKPQFEASAELKNKGIIKNNRIRRDLIKDFENWLKLNKFYVINSQDSSLSGLKGNLERFFLIKKAGSNY